MKRIQVITLGCSKNVVDSEHLMPKLLARGYALAPSAEDLSGGKVDEVLINTCGFIKDAKEESIQTILEAADAKSRGFISKISVFGCLSQRYGSELAAEIPEVDEWQGVMTFDSIERTLTTPRHYAFLKIAEGCDRRCSYCAIPLIRGPHVSVPMEKVLEEARMLAAGGVKELIVIAQDTTWYGLDLYGKRRLGTLLEKLSEIEGIEWIRIHYSYPDGFPDDVLKIMASNPKICNYIDIPLQHSEDAVLKAMRRSVDGAETRRLVEKFRREVPGVVLRTTLMVGHPGEGDKEFESLLRFVEEYKFERLGAFTYSEEEGTYGALHLKDSVPEEVKQERYERLMDTQSFISESFNLSRVGSTVRVVADRLEDGILVCRSQSESPDVDGEILIKDNIQPGTFFDARIIGADAYDLIAEKTPEQVGGDVSIASVGE